MSEETTPKPTRRRCHHCKNMGCPTVGIRQVVEDCPDYDPMDPALRPPRYDRNARRIRKKRSIIVSSANLRFVEDVVLGIDPRMMVGRMTRGVNHCIKTVMEALDGSIPDIPEIVYSGRGEMEKFYHTLPKEEDDFLVRIYDHYKDGNNPVSMSRAVDFCIGMLREAHEGHPLNEEYTYDDDVEECD